MLRGRMWIYKSLMLAAVVAGPGVAVVAEATFASGHVGAMSGLRALVAKTLIEKRTATKPKATSTSARQKLTDETLGPAFRRWCRANLTDKVDEVQYGSIEQWDVSPVTNMSYLFCQPSWGDCTVPHGCNPDISRWNTANVIDMSGMFASSAFNKNIAEWNTGNVASMRGMFASTESFDQPIGKWDTSKVTDMSWMFYGSKKFNQPLPVNCKNITEWNTGNVASVSGMFYLASAFNQTIRWNMAQVTDFQWLYTRPW